MNYNETKGDKDSFYQIFQNIIFERKTKPWPLYVFYNMINIA